VSAESARRGFKRTNERNNNRKEEGKKKEIGSQKFCAIGKKGVDSGERSYSTPLSI
jgi:hypothetical protein